MTRGALASEAKSTLRSARYELSNRANSTRGANRRESFYTTRLRVACSINALRFYDRKALADEETRERGGGEE